MRWGFLVDDYVKPQGKKGGTKGRREGGEPVVVGLLPRLRRAAASLSGRRGGEWANARARG